MKAGREHRVPLADRALEVLDDARELTEPRGIVFPSRRGLVLHQTTLAGLARDLKIGAVPHGSRSRFRDWAAECTDAPREVCEIALAHVNTDRVEAAYRGNPERGFPVRWSTRNAGPGWTMPSMPDRGEGASLTGPGPSRLRRPEPAGAVSAHAGDGPSRFRPPGGEAALTAPQ